MNRRERILLPGLSTPGGAGQFSQGETVVFMNKAAGRFIDCYDELNAGKEFSEFSWAKLGNLYAVASVCYYELDRSVVDNALYDSLCLYLLETLKEALQKENIPLLRIETDYGTGDMGQIRTRIEAFLEMTSK